MRSFVRFMPVAVVCAVLVSCENGQIGGSAGGPYVSNYGNDGGYNPYPGQPGAIQSGSYSPPPATSAPPTYATAPAPSDPYAFSAPSTPASAPPSAPRSSAPKKSTASTSKAKAKAPAKKSGTYTVVSGDTLYGIVRKKGSTVAKIKAANGLTSDLIRPGQKLKIP